MKNSIFIPYFEPPKNAFLIESIEIVGLSMREWESDLSENTQFKLTDMENILNNRSFHMSTDKNNFLKNDIKWTILRANNDAEPKLCKIILDLVSGSWKYLHEQERNAHQSLNIQADKIIGSPAPVHTFTESIKNLSSKGLRLVKKCKKAKVSLYNWESTYTTNNCVDSLLHCCSSLESLFDLDGELRLRLALYTAYYLNKKNILPKVYKMYGIRSDIIHGNKIVISDTTEYMEMVAQVLKKAILCGLPDSEMLDKKIGLKL